MIAGDDAATQAASKLLDAASLLVAVASLAKILPALAALLSCAWYAIRIYEWGVRKWRDVPAAGPAADDD